MLIKIKTIIKENSSAEDKKNKVIKIIALSQDQDLKEFSDTIIQQIFPDKSSDKEFSKAIFEIIKTQFENFYKTLYTKFSISEKEVRQFKIDKFSEESKKKKEFLDNFDFSEIISDNSSNPFITFSLVNKDEAATMGIEDTLTETLLLESAEDFEGVFEDYPEYFDDDFIEIADYLNLPREEFASIVTEQFEKIKDMLFSREPDLDGDEAQEKLESLASRLASRITRFGSEIYELSDRDDPFGTKTFKSQVDSFLRQKEDEVSESTFELFMSLTVNLDKPPIKNASASQPELEEPEEPEELQEPPEEPELDDAPESDELEEPSEEPSGEPPLPSLNISDKKFEPNTDLPFSNQEEKKDIFSTFKSSAEIEAGDQEYYIIANIIDNPQPILIKKVSDKFLKEKTKEILEKTLNYFNKSENIIFFNLDLAKKYKIDKYFNFTADKNACFLILKDNKLTTIPQPRSEEEIRKIMLDKKINDLKTVINWPSQKQVADKQKYEREEQRRVREEAVQKVLVSARPSSNENRTSWFKSKDAWDDFQFIEANLFWEKLKTQNSVEIKPIEFITAYNIEYRQKNMAGAKLQFERNKLMLVIGDFKRKVHKSDGAEKVKTVQGLGIAASQFLDALKDGSKKMEDIIKARESAPKKKKYQRSINEFMQNNKIYIKLNNSRLFNRH